MGDKMPGRRNAVIMAAGTSSRFVPLSSEIPKGLLEVKGDVLIERQIRQLRQAGVEDITVVVGYKAHLFEYLKDKFGVDIVYNEDFARYNNTSSIMRVLDRLDNTFVCSSDNYFPDNVFAEQSGDSYYSALYAHGKTGEYCLTTDDSDNISAVTVGGRDAWYMVGHVFFSREFSRHFREIMQREYSSESTRLGYWEDVYIRHISQLPPMKIHRYREGEIQEFDTLDELRCFDNSYRNDTRSAIIKKIAAAMSVSEAEMTNFKKLEAGDDFVVFAFECGRRKYTYDTRTDSLTAK